MEDDSIDKDELAFVKKSGNIVEGKRAIRGAPAV
jgi:hypothetical protein